ncbi:unnamed protein product [Hydatigera taeniaeformis]|uniref:FXYD domain-containing ion transport regulator n=1 Tax=Hydatigena taeniaeformis TaxID=6205 RepID=A0A0R3WZG4_HYDTA|nr:unnamed protein product [Hydatigera taeniaeformis]
MDSLISGLNRHSLSQVTCRASAELTGCESIRREGHTAYQTEEQNHGDQTMNTKVRDVAILATAICLISLSLILTTTVAKEVGKLELLMQILRALGLLCLLIALITTPFPVPGCTEIERQLRIREIFLLLGSSLMCLVLAIGAVSQPSHMQFWLYTGILFTIISTVFSGSSSTGREETQPEVKEEEQ